MNNGNLNKKILSETISKSSGGKIDSASIDAAMNGNTEALLSKLDKNDKAKIEKLMSDKGSLQKLMSSKAVQQLMKQLSGGK